MAKQQEASMRMPVLALRDLVVFPYMVTGVDIGRDISLKAVRQTMENDGYLLAVAQRVTDVEVPAAEDLYDVGTVVKIRQVLQLPEGVLRVLVEGITRVRVQDVRHEQGMITAGAGDFQEVNEGTAMIETYRRDLMRRFQELAGVVDMGVDDDTLADFMRLGDPGQVADFVATHLALTHEARQELLAEASVYRRLHETRRLLLTEQEVTALEQQLNTEVRQGMDKNQREYYLREKLRVIRNELGDRADTDEEVDDYRRRLAALTLDEEKKEKIEKEIRRLERTPPLTPDAAVIRNYLDWVFDLPWNTETELDVDLARAQEVLDADHYGLEKIKERILEHLAVRQLTQAQKGPILCLVGPPGTGKTSLARSIARALGAAFARVSLGGVHDESEIRGHRRTYVGAMPGRLIQGIVRAKTKNPVFLLDEIDKLGTDFRGDPAAALLEVLDPAQNDQFSDHFIELPFDFSDVFFLMTANTTATIPEPLLDRMEIIELSSYTEWEKLEIAKRYLLPRQTQETGLRKKDTRMSDAVLLKLIREYTREAGVRRLERVIGKICRKIAKAKILGEEAHSITVKRIPDLLGAPRFLPTAAERHDEVGRVTGLAWTQVGGEVLNTEVTALGGSGKMILTGQLGDVMKESAQAAYTYVRSRSQALSIADAYWSKTDVHIHLPEGAIPKDGPSAGITMATAIASAATGRAVRADTAMTGEITLRGNVLPVGGIKEKVLAAHRIGIRRILLPRENQRDLDEIPTSVRDELEFIFVRHMDEVLQKAMVV